MLKKPFDNSSTSLTAGAQGKPAYILLVILILLIGLSVAGWSFLKVEGNKPKSNVQYLSEFLPIPPSNKSVKSVNASYTFSTTIKEIRKNPKGRELIANIKGANIPKFIVSDKTKVVYAGENGDSKPSTSSALMSNQKVEITILYSLKKKKWHETVFSVKIKQK